MAVRVSRVSAFIRQTWAMTFALFHSVVKCLIKLRSAQWIFVTFFNAHKIYAPEQQLNVYCFVCSDGLQITKTEIRRWVKDERAAAKWKKKKLRSSRSNGILNVPPISAWMCNQQCECTGKVIIKQNEYISMQKTQHKPITIEGALFMSVCVLGECMNWSRM